jgi:ParB/RepB/Spo0J family partition protein
MPQITAEFDQIIVYEQARKHFDEIELRRLGENIREHGLLNPPLVKRFIGTSPVPASNPPKELFVLVNGERRLRGMKLVGINKSQFILLNDMDAGDTEVIQYIDNAQRADLLPAEKAHALRAIKEKKEWNNKQCAEHLHMNASLVTRYLAFFDLIPAAQESGAAGKLGVNAWYSMSHLPAEQQAGLLEMHLAHVPAAQIAALSRMKRAAPVSPEQAMKVGKFKGQIGSAVVQVTGQDLDILGLIKLFRDLADQAEQAMKKERADAKAFMALLAARAKGETKDK